MHLLAGLLSSWPLCCTQAVGDCGDVASSRSSFRIAAGASTAFVVVDAAVYASSLRLPCAQRVRVDSNGRQKELKLKLRISRLFSQICSSIQHEVSLRSANPPSLLLFLLLLLLLLVLPAIEQRTLTIRNARWRLEQRSARYLTAGGQVSPSKPAQSVVQLSSISVHLKIGRRPLFGFAPAYGYLRRDWLAPAVAEPNAWLLLSASLPAESLPLYLSHNSSQSSAWLISSPLESQI